MYDDIAQFQRRMPELEEKVVMGLVKKLGMEKEKVEEAHIAFLDKHPEGQMTRFDTFLAALAALGLPWSLVTYLLTVTLIVLDSKPSSLPDQTGNLAKLMWVMKKHGLTNKNTMTKTMQRQRQ